jgi:transposase
MKLVATKTIEQLDLEALQRVRKRLVSQRTGIINQMRAFLAGLSCRQGRAFCGSNCRQSLAHAPIF